MRTLLLLSLILCFSAQSLALVVGPACMSGMAMPQMAGAETADTQTMSMGHHASMHAETSATSETEHSDMPCCEQPEHNDETLCQLTCASGVCSAAAFTAAYHTLQPLADLYPLPFSPSTPLTAEPANLLRPPITA